MNETKEKVVALDVRLKSNDSSGHLRVTNYTNVGVAQGIAYLDFGFIEPALLSTIAKTLKDGQVTSKGIDGQLVTRIAMSVDVLTRLHQQIQEVLNCMHDARPSTAKGQPPNLT